MVLRVDVRQRLRGAFKLATGQRWRRLRGAFKVPSAEASRRLQARDPDAFATSATVISTGRGFAADISGFRQRHRGAFKLATTAEGSCAGRSLSRQRLRGAFKLATRRIAGRAA
jgi:hypothetical protein